MHLCVYVYKLHICMHLHMYMHRMPSAVCFSPRNLYFKKINPERLVSFNTMCYEPILYVTYISNSLHRTVTQFDLKG